MAKREKETTSRQLSEDELIEFARDLFKGRVLSYWQMPSPPSSKELKGGFASPKEEHGISLRKETEQRRAYWKSKAEKLLSHPKSKKNDLEAAEIGTRWNKKLNEKIKERIKQTRK